MSNEPKFPLMAKVRALSPHPAHEGYVIEVAERAGKRIYKLSLDDEGGTWENWVEEELLERC